MAVAGVSMEALAAAMALLQKERVVKEVASEDRCRAIAYDGATGHPVQCSKSKKDGCRYCSLHQKKAEETEEACQYYEDGRKKGLFFGNIPDGEELDASKVPFMSADGMICTVFRGPEKFLERLSAAKASGAKYHPFSNEGGGKKTRQALRSAEGSHPVGTGKKTEEERVNAAEAAILAALLATTGMDDEKRVVTKVAEPYFTVDFMGFHGDEGDPWC